MILKKVIIDKRSALGQYQVHDRDGNVLTLNILPKKRLMNYIKMEVGDSVYMVLSSEEDKEGKLVNKHDFMKDDSLYQQKLKLEEEESI